MGHFLRNLLLTAYAKTSPSAVAEPQRSGPGPQTEDKVSKMIWKKPTSEQWMQFGFVVLFFLGIVSTIIILAKLK